ncbi:MAG TPA: hypothetical protein VNZ52_11790 [Candidatus Thermoplasmatota archaeon]|nr:hypothetical protein [Candidatus Thermoplasmatota archaeon]
MATPPAPRASDAIHHLGHWGRQTASGMLAALTVLYGLLWLKDGEATFLWIAAATGATAAGLALWARLQPME